LGSVTELEQLITYPTLKADPVPSKELRYSSSYKMTSGIRYNLITWKMILVQLSGTNI